MKVYLYRIFAKTGNIIKEDNIIAPPYNPYPNITIENASKPANSKVALVNVKVDGNRPSPNNLRSNRVLSEYFMPSSLSSNAGIVADKY
jgi:hypothetical protein